MHFVSWCAFPSAAKRRGVAPLLYMPVIANASGKGFNRGFQRADVIADSRFFDKYMLTFENVATAGDLDDRLQSGPLLSVGERFDVMA